MWIYLLPLAFLVLVAALSVLHKRLLREPSESKASLYFLLESLNKQWDSLEHIYRDVEKVDDPRTQELGSLIKERKNTKMPDLVPELQRDLDWYQWAYSNALALVPKAKRTGDLTYYTEEMKKTQRDIERFSIQYNELANAFNAKKNEFPYTIPMAITKYADMEKFRLIEIDSGETPKVYE